MAISGNRVACRLCGKLRFTKLITAESLTCLGISMSRVADDMHDSATWVNTEAIYRRGWLAQSVPYSAKVRVQKMRTALDPF